MFDGAADLEDPAAAQATFAPLVRAAARAREEGRFAARCDPEALATRTWVAGHGLTVLVVTGVLGREAIVQHAPAIVTALFTDAGDDPDRCRRSVQAAWAGHGA
jgi:hypothetical protein